MTTRLVKMLQDIYDDRGGCQRAEIQIVASLFTNMALLPMLAASVAQVSTAPTITPTEIETDLSPSLVPRLTRASPR